MKRCYKCKTYKDLDNFYKDRTRKGGFANICKDCSKIKAKLKPINKDYQKKYNKIYREKNIEKLKEYAKNYRQKEENKQHRRLYQKSRIKKILEYEKNKRKTDINFKLKKILRKRLYKALHGHHRNGSAIRDMGCSFDEFKLYMEKQFVNGMCWENHGEWHIDHIKPLSSFDLTNREQLLLACNYKNLQPLFAKDNLSKGSKC